MQYTIDCSVSIRPQLFCSFSGNWVIITMPASRSNISAQMPAKPGNNPIFRITSTMYFFFTLQNKGNRSAKRTVYILTSFTMRIFQLKRLKLNSKVPYTHFKAPIAGSANSNWVGGNSHREKSWVKRMCSVDGLVDCVDCRVCGVWTVDE